MATLNAIVVDDSPLQMRQFRMICADIPGIHIAGLFSAPADALAFTAGKNVDMALLDVDMPDMSGFELAELLRKCREDILIVFVTGHPEYAVEAMRMKADYVIFKPFKRQDIVDVVERARLLSRRQEKRVRIRCFGDFDVFIDDQPLHFKLNKARELMALCVAQNGQDVSIHMLVDRLWDGDDLATTANTSYRMAIKSLADTLTEAGVGQIFERRRGFCRIDRNAVTCDYFDLLDGKLQGALAFNGQFLCQYSWAEEYIFNLQERKQRIEAKAGNA